VTVDAPTAVSGLDRDADAGWRELGRYDGDDPEELVVSLTEAIAADLGADASDLTPLYRAIDPEALAAFVARSTDARVTFVYLDVEVAVDGTGTFSVRDRR
jgi:hypothetical protein